MELILNINNKQHARKWLDKMFLYWSPVGNSNLHSNAGNVKRKYMDVAWHKRVLMFVCAFPGGDQSPESSAERPSGRSPEAAAVGSVCFRWSRVTACHHYFLDHYLLICFLLPVTALRDPPGLPRWRNGLQRCHLVAAGDQPAVDRSHASGGRGGTLEANVSGNDNKNLTISRDRWFLVQGVEPGSFSLSNS